MVNFIPPNPPSYAYVLYEEERAVLVVYSAPPFIISFFVSDATQGKTGSEHHYHPIAQDYC
jgi:hypothetical protein